MLKRRRAWWLGGSVLAVLAAAASWWSFRAASGDLRLQSYVHALPPVPIVFTSRSEPASLIAAAPQGEVLVYPGQRLWQAREGRLRLLTPGGAVHELTWGKRLPDGGTLIDVMSPSISFDAAKILFAGRRSDDHGHFRLYEIDIDGQNLRAVTGGPDDDGCTAVPPLRFGPDGHTLLSDAERRRVDYDDVDPAYLDYTNRFIVFSSSRTPDLGRGHARRATTLWLMQRDSGSKQPFTANRYNDRWPIMMTSGYVAFSHWSRNQEVVSADETDIRPWAPGAPGATAPADRWFGAISQPVGSLFGALVKPDVPVWRPRPLFNGRIAFMTSFDYSSNPTDAASMPALQVVQAAAGLLHSAPSSLPAGAALPAQQDYRLERGPNADARGRRLSLACPSPCPSHHVLLAGAPLEAAPGSYGIYLADDNWKSAAQAHLLFDDPDFVDAEAVAVYARQSPIWSAKHSPIPAPASGEQQHADLPLADGTSYRGPAGTVFNKALYTYFHGDLPGQQTDLGESPIFDRPPAESLHTIKIYASRRDRFDDPVKPRIAGGWELLVEAAVNNHETFGARLPAGVPTVLAGFTKEGRVLRWTTAARDSQGRQASFYAYAGDHYSAVRPFGRHSCTGCHPGHSALPRSAQNHAERLR